MTKQRNQNWFACPHCGHVTCAVMWRVLLCVCSSGFHSKAPWDTQSVTSDFYNKVWFDLKMSRYKVHSGVVFRALAQQEGRGLIPGGVLSVWSVHVLLLHVYTQSLCLNVNVWDPAADWWPVQGIPRLCLTVAGLAPATGDCGFWRWMEQPLQQSRSGVTEGDICWVFRNPPWSAAEYLNVLPIVAGHQFSRTRLWLLWSRFLILCVQIHSLDTLLVTESF